MKLVLPACLLAAACSGGGAEDADLGGKIARIEIAPASVMLTGNGDSHALTARAFTADGTEIPAEVMWSSSRGDVDVAADGIVTATRAVGASQLVASVDGVTSSPALVTIVEVAPNVTVIDDAQIVEGPRAVDPSVREDLDAPYEIVLRGPAPAPGTLLLGGEGISVGGEVVSSVVEGENARVVMKLVPLPQLVANAELDETIDGTAIAPDVPPELAAAYDITFVDGEYRYTPKPNARANPIAATANADGTIALPPIGKCETSLPALPISLGGLPQFSAKLEPTFQVTYNTREQVERFIVKAEPTFKAQINLVVNVDATFGLECKSPLYSKVLKFPGWAGLLLAGEVEAGIALELEGKITLFSAGVELSTESTTKLEMGVECLGGKCSLVKKLEGLDNKNKVQWVVPSLGQTRVEPAMFGGGYAALKLGATLLEQARIEMVKAKIGGKYEASLSPATLQTEETDPDYRSSYQFSLLGKIGAGKKIGGLLAKLGIQEFTPLELSTSVPLASSPKGTAVVDKVSFEPGDVVKFKVQLDPTSIDLPGLGYNIERITILHKRGQDFIPVEIATVAPSAAAQVDFDLQWTADVSSKTAGAQFFAFVDTILPSIVDLELGKAVAGPAGSGACVPSGLAQFCVEELPEGFGFPRAISSTGTVITDSHVIRGATATPLPASFSAIAINDRDEIAGLLSDNRVAIVKNGVVVSAVAMPAGHTVQTVRINNRGELAIDLRVERPGNIVSGRVAIVRRDAGGNQLPLELLPSPGAEFQEYVFLNERGDLAFVATDPEFGAPFVTIAGATATTRSMFIPHLGGIDSLGNIAGDEVVIQGDNAPTRPWQFRDGVLSPLASPGFSDASVIGMTDREIVGNAFDTISFEQSVLVWSAPDFAPRELDSSIDTSNGLHLTAVSAIAQNGAMLAFGRNGQFGLERPLRLIPASNANMFLEIVAPQGSVTPGNELTYGVNVRNFGPTVASDVLVEFTLPDGMVLVEAIGWQSCATTGSYVVCAADTFGVGEQRAFLVTVVAPVDTGSFATQARVSSSSHDPNYANNERTVTTVVAE